MKIERLWEYKDDFLVLCKIFVPRSEGLPLTSPMAANGSKEQESLRLLFWLIHVSQSKCQLACINRSPHFHISMIS